MACFCNIIQMQFSPFGLVPFLTTNWPWRNCYLDSGCKCACLAAELYFNETPLSCSCEALLLCAMFDKSLCKECAQTPAPLKPFRATGHGNCVFGPGILSSANCYFSQHRACITVSFHCPLWPLYLESCNIMRDDNGDFIRGEVEWLKLPKWEFGEQSHYVSRKTLSPLQLYLFYFRYLPVQWQHTMAVRLRPLTVVHEPLKRYSETDFSSLSRVLRLDH